MAVVGSSKEIMPTKHFVSAASINATQLAEGSAIIDHLSLINTSLSMVYLKFCELADGDDTPDPTADDTVWVEPIPPNDGTVNGANIRNISLALRNPGYWLTTDEDDDGDTAVGAGDVIVSMAGRWRE